MEGPGIKPVPNETESFMSRVTKDGRTLTYRLRVIQQPSRARACGSGAKSSADRRPVDPPPIVELTILEGEGPDDQKKDVTFSLNCSYFLFATLEQARVVAHGRVQQEQHRPTVLTGTPVAGMVLLDRPTPAGYFIFTDLSVRHEGKYRLSFALFEEVKETKDQDRNEDAVSKPNGPRNGNGHASVDYRMDVRSIPFTVYSAKKFPGLAESTALSRQVAEQGCRVRIRRDCRMRKRDTKGNKDWDGYEDETYEMRARSSVTPEAPGFSNRGYPEPIPRPRSTSNSNHPALAPSLSRRPSLQDITQGYAQPSYGTPQTPQAPYPQSSPYLPSPNHSYPPLQFAQQQQSLQPPPASYNQAPHLPPAGPPSGYYPYSTGPPGYDAPYHTQRNSSDYSAQAAPDSRRPSNMYSAQVPNLPPPYAYPSAHSSQPAIEPYNRLVPAEPVQPPISRTNGAHTPLSARPFNDRLPPLSTTINLSSTKHIEVASPASSGPQAGYFNVGPRAMDTNKRNYGQTFNERHLAQPARMGQRPGSLDHYNSPADTYITVDMDGNDEAEYEFKSQMSYRRADGRQVNRLLPPHEG